MYDEYDDYYEDKSINDEIFNEAFDKLKENLRTQIKDDIKDIARRESNLSRDKERLNKDRLSIAERERDLNKRENELIKKEKEFFSTPFKKLKETILKDSFDKIYSIDDKYVKKEKCNNCNDKRKIRIKLYDNSTVEVDCPCSKQIQTKIPKKREVCQIEIYSSKEECKFEIETYLFNDYNERADRIDRSAVFKKFSDLPEDIKNKGRKYGIYFTAKEECQLYCDFLNRQ